MNSEPILHHYPPSPVAEKIRAAFGLKQMQWHSVEENRMPPRPELFAMTGGYRRIPVLQVGADLYCDTQVIFAELEARKPEPTLFPGGGAGMPYAVSRWTDGELFQSAFRVAFLPMLKDMPPEFVADRARLYVGPNADLEAEFADMDHTLVQFRAQLGWLDERLSTGRSYLLGEAPGMPDLLSWTIYWFVTERWKEAGAFFEEFTHLNAWAKRMRALGHGTSSPMSPQDALSIAKAATPITPKQDDPRDPQGLKTGQKVAIAPTTDSGEAAVEGMVQFVSRDRIAIARQDPACGDTVVHFPRVGFRVSTLD